MVANPEFIILFHQINKYLGINLHIGVFSTFPENQQGVFLHIQAPYITSLKGQQLAFMDSFQCYRHCANKYFTCIHTNNTILFFFIIHLFMAVLGLHCFAWTFASCGE